MHGLCANSVQFCIRDLSILRFGIQGGTRTKYPGCIEVQQHMGSHRHKVKGTLVSPFWLHVIGTNRVDG